MCRMAHFHCVSNVNSAPSSNASRACSFKNCYCSIALEMWQYLTDCTLFDLPTCVHFFEFKTTHKSSWKVKEYSYILSVASNPFIIIVALFFWSKIYRLTIFGVFDSSNGVHFDSKANSNRTHFHWSFVGYRWRRAVFDVELNPMQKWIQCRIAFDGDLPVLIKNLQFLTKRSIDGSIIYGYRLSNTSIRSATGQETYTRSTCSTSISASFVLYTYSLATHRQILIVIMINADIFAHTLPLCV